jgi:hypothetical protein
MTSRPTVNVYTGLAFVSAVVSLAALIYLVFRCLDMGIFH